MTRPVKEVDKGQLLRARSLLLEGKTVEEVRKETGLTRSAVNGVKGWLRTPKGKHWANDLEEAKRRLQPGGRTVLPTPADPGVISITIHGGTLQITGEDHKKIWRQLKSMVDAYFAG